MVKGITRQVILVDSPDKRKFERAIFILREGEEERAEDLLLQAQEIAERSMRAGVKPRRRLPSLLYLAAGASLTGVIWLIFSLLRG